MPRLFPLPRLAVLLVVLTMAPDVGAQEMPGDDAEAFCRLVDTDLLTALNGSWSIQNGGGAVTAPMFIPLPPGSTESIVFQYNPEDHYVDVRSADLSDEMIMFVPPAEQKQQSLELLGKNAQKNAGASPCDWNALPVLVGTNTYVTYDSDTWTYYVTTVPYCKNVTVESVEAATAEKYKGLIDPADQVEWCKKQLAQKAPAPRKMDMTLVLRFTSAQHGSGTLHFEGEEDGYPYEAWRDVVVSR